MRMQLSLGPTRQVCGAEQAESDEECRALLVVIKGWRRQRVAEDEKM